MKKTVKLFGRRPLACIALAAIIAISMAACGGDDPEESNQIPTAADYDISDNLEQAAGKVTAVTVTAKPGKSPGAVVNVKYAGSETVPQAEGTYAVTFDVAAATGWDAATVSAGTLAVNGGSSMETAILLTAGAWEDGDIPTSDGEQWFKFTATAATQYIHVGFFGLTNLDVQLYNSSGTTAGISSNLYGSTRIASKAAAAGLTYYIRVTPYSDGDSGTYRIAFDTSKSLQPDAAGGATLTEDVQVSGGIPPEPFAEEWFSFTATAAKQYIHVGFFGLTNLYVQLYNPDGTTNGSRVNFRSSNTPYASWTVTPGQTYYIRVTPYSDGDSGTYTIRFSKY